MLTDDLASPDLSIVRQALARAIVLIEEGKASNEIRTWIGALLKNRRYSELEELTAIAIPHMAGDTAMLQHLQEIRVRAFLGMEKPSEALAAAKSLYNVTTMSGTADAVLLFCEALNLAYSGNQAIV